MRSLHPKPPAWRTTSLSVAVLALACVPTVGCSKSEVAGGEGQSDSGVELQTQPAPSAIPEAEAEAEAGVSTMAEEEAAPLFGGGSAGEITIEDEVDVADAGAEYEVAGYCADAVGMGQEPMIDDFEDGDSATLEIDGRSGTWYHYNADGDLDSHVLEYVGTEQLPSGGELALHTAGSGYEWAGIGAGFRWSAPNEDGVWVECVYDASVYEGIRFWARGNDAEVLLTLSIPEVITLENNGTCDPAATSCWNAHGIDLVLVDEWVEYMIPFSDFEQPSRGEQYGELDASRLRVLQFELAPFTPFDIWIEDLAFYTEGTPPSEPFVPEPEESDTGGESLSGPDAGASADAGAAMAGPNADDGGL